MDSDLRNHERRAAGDLEARKNLLVARLRSGQITQRQLHLLCYCFDEAALELDVVGRLMENSDHLDCICRCPCCLIDNSERPLFTLLNFFGINRQELARLLDDPVSDSVEEVQKAIVAYMYSTDYPELAR